MTDWKCPRIVPAALLCLIVASLSLSEGLFAAGESRTGLLEAIDAVVEEARAADQIPGVSVAVHWRGEELLANGYGLADVENNVPATEHTVYRIGSVTKQYTAAAVMKLVEQGKLNLEDAFTKYLPDYPVGDFTISVGQLLDHTAGIKGYTEMPVFWEKGRLDLTHEEMIELFSEPPFEFEPGERFQYSNSAYYLAGVVVEKVSGKSYADFLRDEFFEPLGLRESYYLYNTPIVPNRAEGYEVRDGELVNDDPLSMHLPYSAGSLGASVSDLVRWKLALIQGRALTPKSFAEMVGQRTLRDGKPAGYGLGFFVGSLDGHRKVSHGGGINGFRAQLSWYPDDELIVAVLTNSGSANPGPLETRVARLVLGLEAPLREPVELSATELKRYAGLYNAGRNMLPIMLQDGALTMFGTKLVPIGDHRFVSENDPDRVVTFEVEGDEVVGFEMNREGISQTARRHSAEAPD